VRSPTVHPRFEDWTPAPAVREAPHAAMTCGAKAITGSTELMANASLSMAGRGQKPDEHHGAKNHRRA